MSAKLKWGHTNRGAKYRWGRLNAGVVAENWRLLMQSIVNLALTQVYHTERVHVTCLQHVRRDGVRRAGLLATADRCSGGSLSAG